ncbi:tRNA (adenosine(37)-N6)-threonylcarbamoyltransferase complex dimerization subunit type 1 TsaB [Scrofimicrobium sp. R131]|uniref:tRNA (Adenosine(37)-N6)-threonylcarbamoyltransferase complex dimerization subunit type 1 TsaB n=1 Tax=Scrofimicrobium appendicitidis TaxID=3079930 RepID=A0AAU7V6J5_9ACTO
MLELCLDTSAGASVAVVEDGAVLARAREDNPRRHAEELGVLLETVCRAAGIDGPIRRAPWDRVCVGTGPAPFTGLRAGLITAQVFARTAGVELYGVPSLAIVARGALDLLPDGHEVLAVTDARRQEVYWARYRAAGPNGLEELSAPAVGRPESLGAQLRQGDAVLVGPGAHLVRAVLPASVGPVDEADAAVASRLVAAGLARGEDLPAQPLYLRRPDIHGAQA